jgi:hypothetical protein
MTDHRYIEREASAREEVLAVRYMPGQRMDDFVSLSESGWRFQFAEVPAWSILLIRSQGERGDWYYQAVPAGDWLCYSPDWDSLWSTGHKNFERDYERKGPPHPEG